MTSDDENSSATLQHENDQLRQRVAELEQLLAANQPAVAATSATTPTTDGTPPATCATCQAFLDSFPAMLFAKNRQGEIILVNRQWEQFNYIARTEALGKTDQELYPANIAAANWEIASRVLETSTILEQEDEIPTANGLRTYGSINFPIYDNQGQIAAVGSTATDITVQRQDEDALRLFKALAEHAPDGIVVSGLDNIVTYINPAFERLAGYSTADLGRHAYEFYAEEDAILQEVTRLVKAQRFWQGQFTYRRKSGGMFTGHLSIFLVLDDDSTPIAIARIIRDLTGQQRIEAERAALQQQVIAAQQAALRELSTPLIPLTSDIVLMPLIGAIDSQRAHLVVETLLAGVAAQHAHLVILDITGVAVVDTQVAQVLLQAAQAVRLLGARIMLTGIQPQIAETLVHLGIDLRGVLTHGSLQMGIAWALGREKI
ncbi:MAG: PAS domain S-box protein [Chloroflexaceae bacterium]